MSRVIRKIMQILGVIGVVSASICGVAFADATSVQIEGIIQKFDSQFVWLNSRGEEQIIPRSLLGKSKAKEGMFVSVTVPLEQPQLAED